MKKGVVYLVWAFVIASISFNIARAQRSDTLKNVKVFAIKKTDLFAVPVQIQQLNKTQLQQINSISVADAARFFSGVVLKDYGGIGGLKTISVRSLGANHTGVLYDGMMMGDAQGGQIDLGTISLDQLEQISLFNHHPSTVLLPAKSFASAAVLSLETNRSNFAPGPEYTLKVSGGSFGFVNASFTAQINPTEKNKHQLHASWQSATGDYQFRNYETGEGNSRRKNADTRNLRIEYNTLFRINDSNQVSFKSYFFHSRRGLPGSIIFYYLPSGERLNNRLFFTQASWNKRFRSKINMLLSGKFTSDYKYYLDPDYQNNSGRLVNEFKQKEYYASAAFSYPLLKHLTAGISTDYLYNSLKRSDTFAYGFANPGRHSIYSNVALQYKKQRFEIFGHLLYSNFSEQVENGKPAAPQQQWVPAFAVSYQPVATWPVRLRASFKKTFRMPSFDDLYYTNIGNSSLRPEYATLLNVGVSTRFKSSKLLREINISADAYFNKVKDKILAVPRQDLFQWSMLNIGKSEATGIDIACSATFNPIPKLQLNVHSTYSYQRSLDLTNPNEALYKTQLPYTPEHSGTAGISALYHHWSLHYNIVSSGYRYRAGEQLAANLVQGWATHDISIATEIVSSSKFSYKAIFEINNLLNTQYEIIKYYPMQRLNYRISLAVTFKKEKTTK